MSYAPQWAALSGIALTILMCGVLIGYMIARTVTERRDYDAEIAGYEQALAARREPRHARPPLPPELEELEAPKSIAPPSAPPAGIGPLQGSWPRPARIIVITPGAQRAQRSRWPLEDTGRMPALTDTGELRALEAITTAAIDRMRADNAAWLEEWAGAAR